MSVATGKTRFRAFFYKNSPHLYETAAAIVKNNSTGLCYRLIIGLACLF